MIANLSMHPGALSAKLLLAIHVLWNYMVDACPEKEDDAESSDTEPSCSSGGEGM